MERYQINDCLDEGVHACTFLATEVVSQQKVVLKLLDWTSMPTSDQQGNDHMPIRLDALAETLDVFPVTSNCVLPKGLGFRPKSAVVSEFCEGGNLNDWIRVNNGVDPVKKLEIFKAIADGLNHLHQLGLVHGNLKGSNVVFKAGKPKLCDGMLIRDDGSQFVFPCLYSAPEVHCHQGGVFSHFSDVYSLGILLVQLFTENRGFSMWLRQEPVFITDNLNSQPYLKVWPSLRRKIPECLLDLMSSLLCHSKEKRIFSKAMLSYLQTLIDSPELFNILYS